jgi:hypothetical protein
MNDFLTRLSERLRPERLVLRPVLPSRFEQASTMEPFWRESIDPSLAVDAQAGGNPPAARSKPDDHAAHMFPSVQSAHAVERQNQDSTAHVVAQNANRSLDAGKSFAQSERALAHPENRRATHVSRTTLELSLTAESQIPVKERESVPIDPRIKGQLLRDPKAAFPSSRFDPPPPEQGALQPLPANSTHQRVGRDSAAAFESKTLASPEIRVTIGRIEVRAIVAPSGGPRLQAPRAPQSSLDDYLRSRKEAVA